MAQEGKDREKLINSLNSAAQELSTWTVMFHTALAERVDLNVTDHKCLDILSRHGAMTAGQLAEITGLTTGAVTGVIDRLEKAGFAHRERDPNDRRRVIVQPDLEKASKEMGPLFDHLSQQHHQHLEAFQEAEIESLIRYTKAAAQMMREEIDWLRGKKQV